MTSTAADRARDLRGREPIEASVELPEPEGEIEIVGDVISMTYRIDRDGEDLEAQHTFRSTSRPQLGRDDAGQAYLIGGRYSVGRDGIEDGGRTRAPYTVSPDDDCHVLGELAELVIEIDGSTMDCTWPEGDGPLLIVDPTGGLHLEAVDLDLEQT